MNSCSKILSPIYSFDNLFFAASLPSATLCRMFSRSLSSFSLVITTLDGAMPIGTDCPLVFSRVRRSMCTTPCELLANLFCKIRDKVRAYNYILTGIPMPLCPRGLCVYPGQQSLHHPFWSALIGPIRVCRQPLIVTEIVARSFNRIRGNLHYANQKKVSKNQTKSYVIEIYLFP